jgi:hypothetical protein
MHTLQCAAAAAAAEGCTVVPGAMLTGAKYVASFPGIEDAETCCALCRNTPRCTVWSYCEGSSSERASGGK